ncbi:MAG: manganese transporter [Bacteroidetes bacterium]|nr:MAG: manganese transporter [Bacteroidota bacterium]REK54337.1 MAG: manganese transporter [Bacteroidota bacterium]
MRYLLSFLTGLVLFSCAAPTQDTADDKIKVVCTTSIMTDWVSNVASDKMEVLPLLKVGIDPHVYKPSKKDLDLLRDADVIVYHGLHLEGKIIEVLEHMNDKLIIDAAKNFPDELIIRDPNFPASTDPHAWFDKALAQNSIKTIVGELSQFYSEESAGLLENMESYFTAMDEVAVEVDSIISTIPQEQRLVITTHDALSYFARQYGLRVKTLQGASTVSEFGLREITDLVDFIVEAKVPAIFLENIVSPQAMESVQRGCASKGFEVEIGPELLSDSLGSEQDQNTYFKMLIFNAKTIAEYLK